MRPYLLDLFISSQSHAPPYQLGFIEAFKTYSTYYNNLGVIAEEQNYLRIS